jgi:tetratricopeptide (TPR) repeat protein
MHDRDPDDAAVQRDLTRAYNQTGAVLLAANPQEALRSYEKALALGEAALAGPSKNPEVQERQAESLQGIANALSRLRRNTEALENGHRALEIGESLAAADRNNAFTRFALARHYGQSADVAAAARQPALAREYARKGLAIVQPMAEEDAVNWLKRRACAEAKARVARLEARIS